jgi:hypothetical protein
LNILTTRAGAARKVAGLIGCTPNSSEPSDRVSVTASPSANPIAVMRNQPRRTVSGLAVPVPAGILKGTLRAMAATQAPTNAKKQKAPQLP